MAGTPVQHMIRGYDKTGDALLFEMPLKPIPLELLRQLFGEADDSPMYECYPVDADQLGALRGYLEQEPDPNLEPTLARCDLFLECDGLEQTGRG